MRFLRQSLTGLFLAAVTLALLLYAGQTVMTALEVRMANESRAPQARERVFAVNVITAKMEQISPVLEAFGEVQSRRTLELRAALPGRIVRLADGFEEGGVVAAGDVLVEIDPADAQAKFDRAQSDLLDAEAEERDAKRSLQLARDEVLAAEEQSALRSRAFQRQKDLRARGVGTAMTVESAELAAASARQSVLARRIAEAKAENRVDQAATRLNRARISLLEAERDLTDTTVVAGFDGTLSEVNLVEGRLVSANERLAKLVDPMALEVAFRISTAQYARLLDGQGALVQAPVEVFLDVTGADLRAVGEISRDSAAAGAGQSGRQIFAGLTSAPGFKPGDFVTVKVLEPPLDNVARVPASALGAEGAVLVLGAENRLESLPVTLVRRQGDDVLIRGQNLSGRDVVVGRTPLLGAGIRVRPLQAPSSDGEPAQPQMIEPEMLELSAERRAKLVQFVEANTRMPAEAKERVLGLLGRDKVPARLVQRIESRMGG